MRSKNYGINVRVTEQEKQKLLENARFCSLSLSEYLRRLGLGKEVRVAIRERDYRLFRMLNGLKAELPKFLFRVVDFMESRAKWVGTATELLTEMKEQEVTPNMVTKYLGQFAYEVLEPLGIEYRTKRTGKSRLIKFLRRDGDDANDAGIAI